MASIPLPALASQPPPSPVDQVGKLLQMKSLLQGQQLQQQQITGAEQENQMRQMQLQDMQTIQKIAPNYVQKDDSGKVTGYDFDGLTNGAVAAGVRPQSLAQLQTMRKNAADTFLAQQQGNAAAIKNQNDLNDQLTGHLEAFRNAPPEQKQTELDKAYQTAQANHLQWSLPRDANAVTPQMLDTAETGLAMHSQFVKEAQEKAQTAAENAKAALDNVKVQGLKASPQDIQTAIAGIVPQNWPDPTLAQRTMSRVNAARVLGDTEGMNKALADASAEVGSIQKETNPAVQNAKLVLAARTKLADQAITQGSPEAAGKLLADGSLTLSELKSRGTTPQFIVAATQAAQAANPGFNPQKAEADLGVAKSPANLAFFGSAKSLTDPGGTLDQLKAASKDIPAEQIPVFNTVADAIKASTGSGPIAKYAALTLGVADDYSKVMGGGQGSDTSRSQAMNIIGAKLSPEQRDAAIEGIRGAVGSQTTSRIGNNSVLQRMYGQGNHQPSQPLKTGAPPAGATHTAMGSDGKRHYTNSQGQDLGVAQ